MKSRQVRVRFPEPNWHRGYVLPRDVRAKPPANDNLRIRIPKPANDNMPRVPLKEFGKLVRKLQRLTPAGRYIDFLIDVGAFGSPGGSAALPVPLPDLSLQPLGVQWTMRHGPNDLDLYGGFPYTSSALSADVLSAYIESWSSGPNTGLIAGQAITPVPVDTPIPSGSNRASYWYQNQVLSQRFAQAAAFEKTGDPALDPDPGKALETHIRLTLGLPERFVAMPDPFLQPTRSPLQDAPPTPGFQPNPYRRNHNSPRLSEIVHALQPPALGNVSVQPSLPRPAPVPLPPTVVVTPTVPGTVPSPIGRPGHQRKPPGPGVKERKGKLDILYQGLGDAFGAATEFNDFVSSLHDALPKHLQAKSFHGGRPIQPSWKKKWKAVWDNINEVDIGDALTEIVKNEVEDQLLGRASKRANDLVNDGSTGKGRMRVNKFRAFRH